jgi:hypothetical protein
MRGMDVVLWTAIRSPPNTLPAIETRKNTEDGGGSIKSQTRPVNIKNRLKAFA